MERDDAFKKIADILRISPDILHTLEAGMAKATGKTTVIEDVAAENAKRVLLMRNMFGLRENTSAEKVHGVMLDALRQSDAELYELFRQPDGTSIEGLRSLFNFARDFAAPGKGLFLKLNKAQELLRKCPPQKILSFLEYPTVDALLKKESIFEIYAALRVVEGAEWLNTQFFKEYESLSIADFEERDMALIVLGGKWLDIAKKYQEKKYHNVSHLKEMGVIFVIPDRIDTPGETIRMFGLLSHYIHEVSFYTKLIRHNRNSAEFAGRIISFLRGDVPSIDAGKKDPSAWLIVQRYLAKENDQHPLLFTPHVSPEALHWRRTERDIARLNDRFSFTNVGFWYNLDFVGDFFRSEIDGSMRLISFDLLDNVMSLVMEKHMVKYLYHQQEALWNKIFMEYMGGEEVLEKMLIDNFEKQVITL